MNYTRISDKNSIQNLLKEFLPVFPNLEEKIGSLDEYAQKLSEFAYVFSITDNVESKGILVFYANNIQNRTAYISLIGVKKEYERQGLGKALLTYCEEVSRECGMCKLKLEVDDNNTNAIKFYEKNGFKFSDTTERNSFYMQKNI